MVLQPKEALEKWGFRFRHRLGQNFIFDEALLRRVVEASDAADKNVLEVGAGAGSLTLQLSDAARRVVSVEIDEKLLAVLGDVLAGRDNVRLIHADIMKTDIPALVRESFGGPYSVVANLPYYITTPVIMKFLESETPPESMSVMVQKEVASRLVAAPGTKDYGAITVSVAYRALVSVPMKVPAGCFTPRPKVDSALVRMDILPEPAVKVQDERIFFRAVRAGFAMRRKTLLNNICAGFSLPRAEGTAVLEAAGIDPGIRGEMLGLEAYGRIADALAAQ